MHREAWLQLEDARRNQEPGADPDFEAMIVSLYGPGGVAFDALREELLGAQLLADRKREVNEVLASLGTMV